MSVKNTSCHLLAMKYLYILFGFDLFPVDHERGLSPLKDLSTMASPLEEVDMGEEGLSLRPAISLLGDSLRPFNHTSILVFFGDGSTSFEMSSSSVWSLLVKREDLISEKPFDGVSQESLLSWLTLMGEPKLQSEIPSSELMLSTDCTATCFLRKDVMLFPVDFSSNLVKAENGNKRSDQSRQSCEFWKKSLITKNLHNSNRCYCLNK